MGACTSSEPSSGDASQALVVDVQKVVADHVWRVFRDTHSKGRKKSSMKQRDYTIEVPMKYFHFDKTGQEVNIRKQDGGDPSDGTFKPKEKLPNRDKTSPEQKGLQTHYRNDTGEAQVFQFNFEKTRRSSARVSYQKGFTFGGKTDFTLELPKILPGGELGAEVDMNMEVSKTEEQTFEEESTTAVTSAIAVSPYSLCVANVLLEDIHFTADYKVYITMEMPAKEAEVFVRNKDGERIYRYLESALHLLFPKAHHLTDADGKVRKDALQFVVEGVINGSQISNQTIKLDSYRLQQNTSTKHDLVQ